MGGKCDINCGTNSSNKLFYSNKDWLDGSSNSTYGFLSYEAWLSSKKNQKENVKKVRSSKKVNNSSSKTGRRSPLN